MSHIARYKHLGLRTFSTMQKKNFVYGYDIQCGPRQSMEDFIVCNDSFTDQYSLFAVFDGHGGDLCSKFLANNIESFLKVNLYKNQYHDMQQLLENTMKEIDEIVTKPPEASTLSTNMNKLPIYYMGSTAIVALIDNHSPNKIIISNVGDSKCLKIDKDNNLKQISIDHHPRYHQFEKERLININQLNTMSKYYRDDTRIPHYFGDGPSCLSMTRCIGNGRMKDTNPNLFLSIPDVIEYEWKEDDKYLILCSNGLYDDINDIESMLDFHDLTTFDQDPQDLAQLLTQCVLYEKHTRDNISVIIIKIYAMILNAHLRTIRKRCIRNSFEENIGKRRARCHLRAIQAVWNFRCPLLYEYCSCYIQYP